MSESERLIHDESSPVSTLVDDELLRSDDEDEEDDLTIHGERIQIEKNDRSLAELHRWKQQGRLIVDPEWQRKYVWDDKRASRLVESFLLELPIPVIYLSQTEDANYEVIDGLQRLTSIFRFFDGSLKLSKLQMLEEHNGKYYKDLEVKLQNRLQDITLRTFELDKTTSKDMLFVIFERLNTGGVPLNDMEIRNCIFRGAINQLICELVEDENFKQVVNQQGLSTRMVDRELVLRFLAFYQFHYSKATTGIKAFLNEFSQTYQHANAQKTSEFRDKFKKAMRASFTIFGSSGFRVIQSDTYKIAPRVNKTIFQAVATSFAEYDIGALTRSADSIYEAYFDLVQSDRYFYDCTRTATGDQRRLKYVFETWRTRLDNIMSTVEANDSVRLFSRELKKQMFAESQVCAICNQQISHINDAALDHDRHYWLGGKTVPENARLVHRQCNWERPNS